MNRAQPSFGLPVLILFILRILFNDADAVYDTL